MGSQWPDELTTSGRITERDPRSRAKEENHEEDIAPVHRVGFGRDLGPWRASGNTRP